MKCIYCVNSLPLIKRMNTAVEYSRARILHSPSLIFRIFVFVMHFIMSIILVSFLFVCKTAQFNSDMYKTVAYDYTGWAASSQYDGTCNSPVTCYREAKPWDNGVVISGNWYWNPYALLMVIEWLTASFSLFYVAEKFRCPLPEVNKVYTILTYIAVGWNAVGLVLYFGWLGSARQGNGFEIVLVFVLTGMACLIMLFFEKLLKMWVMGFPQTPTLIATKALSMGKIWNIPKKYLRTDAGDDQIITEVVKKEPADERDNRGLEDFTAGEYALNTELTIRMRVVMRYMEYSITAPLLFLVILCLVVEGPPYWAYYIGYMCMFICCLCGVPAHILHLLEVLGGKIHHVEHEDMVSDHVIPPDVVPAHPVVPVPDGDGHEVEPGDWHYFGTGGRAMVIAKPVAVRKNNKRLPVINASMITPNNPFVGDTIAIEKVGPAYDPDKAGKISYVNMYTDHSHQYQNMNVFLFLLSFGLMGQWRSTAVAKLHYIQLSSFGLCMALGLVVYLARDLIISTILPMYVNASLWIMLLLYCSFGVVGTLYYYFLDRSGWRSMPVTLDILSFLAKVPIALTLTAGYMNAPGNLCYNNAQ